MKKILFLFLSLCFPVLAVYAKGYDLNDIKPCSDNNTYWCDEDGMLINGVIKGYYPDETLKYELNFRDGVLDGIQESYHKNGNLKNEIIFKVGKPDGIWKMYFEDGKLAGESKFENEVIQTTLYDDKGNKVKEAKYLNEQFIQKEYYEDVTLKSEWMLKTEQDTASGKNSIHLRKDGIDFETPHFLIKEGWMKEYRKNGQLSSEAIYQGPKDLRYKEYHENDHLKFEMDVKNGEIISYQLYDDDGSKIDMPDEVLYISIKYLAEKLGLPSTLAEERIDLYHAAEMGNLEKVKELVKNGKDVNMVCQYFCSGWTPVMIASANEHLDTVKFLLENGANPNAQNYAGRTALMFASRYGYKPIINVLLEYGADPTITSQDANQNSAMADMLIRSLADPKAYEILKLFVKKTGQVNFEFWDYIPLMMALRYDDYDFAKYLLDNGANPNHVKIVEKDGKSERYDMEGMAESEKMKELIRSYQKKN